LGLEGSYLVVPAVDYGAVSDGFDLDIVRRSVSCESDTVADVFDDLVRAVDTDRVFASLKRPRLCQTRETEEVVAVFVGHKDVVDGEPRRVSHHLSLGPFAAVEKQQVAFAFDGDRAR
jgi:hypothetical protein